jgi:hypothetical protein
MKRINKFLKWTSITFFVLLLFGLLFRGSLYRLFFNYQIIGHRTTYVATNKELTDYIDNKTVSFKPSNINDIIEISLRLTSNRLTFREAKNDSDPNQLIRTKYAHCVGYSAFFSATCNYLLNKFGFADNWISEPLIGQINFCGTNIHQFFKSSFFKDHDFNRIINKKTGEVYFVDPTINDYLFIDYVKVKQEHANEK